MVRTGDLFDTVSFSTAYPIGATAIRRAPPTSQPSQERRMTTHLIFLLITLSIAVLAATLTATAAGLLAWLGGVRPPSAMLRAGIAFGGTLTLEVMIIGLALSVLG
jgi:hypothetical protein